MKFDSWLNANRIKTVWGNLYIVISEKIKTKNLHIIGICGGCDFHGTRRAGESFPNRCILLTQDFPETFGCIHFQGKGEKEK